MRSKVKVTSREEILRNFTREFLIEEKKRCEIDRYVTDFRILIHKMPHENHNYLNRLLQDYTSMFLSHERMSVNKCNEGEMKHRLVKQLASKKKESPKQRYVKSKSYSKNSEASHPASYLVLKAKTEEFLQNLRKYEELEQIAYEIFVKLSNNESVNQIKVEYNQNYSINQNDRILKLKTVEVPLEIPYKKTYKHVYVLNSSETEHVNQIPQNTETSLQSSAENPLKNYEYVKNATSKFIENNKNYNDAEQKILSEQYQNNIYIKKYVDNLNSCNRDAKKFNSPKKGFFKKIKNMMGLSPEKSPKTKEEKPLFLKPETESFLDHEKTFNNFEFIAYKSFYTRNGEFCNPLFEPNKKNIALSSPSTIKQTPIEVMKHITFSFESDKEKTIKNASARNKKQPNVEVTKASNLEKIPKNNTDANILKQQTLEFLHQQKNYEDDQHNYYVIFINEHPNFIVKAKNKKESLMYKIRQLFKFGKSDKSKEKLYHFTKLTDEFLRNERYYYDQEHNSIKFTSKRPTDLEIETPYKKDTLETVKLQPPSKTEKLSPMKTEQSTKFSISPSVLHQRSRSEDLLTLKSKTKSLDNRNKTSPTGHKSLSDRLKRMVGIGNRKIAKSRENMLHLTDPVQYFLNHERFYYDGQPENPKHYNRSVSLMNQSGKSSMLRQKVGNFKSAENIFNQDRNDGVSGKPPSGRRRQERRSEGEKSKRRSRTLSPAQRLVSKFKNIMHRDGRKKEEEENWQFLRNQTEKFLKDQKNFHNSERKIESFDNSINYKHYAKENYKINQTPRGKQNYPINENKKNNNKQQTRTNVYSNSSVRSENEFQKTDTENLKLQNNSKSPRNAADLTDSKDSILDNPELLKTRTKMFLLEMKKYNDFDKAADDVNKTLIFVNNKTPEPKNIMGINKSSDETPKKTESIRDIDATIYEREKSSTENTSGQFTEQNFTMPVKTSPRGKCEEVSTEKIFSETIKSETLKKEEKITRKVITERIQTKSITVSNWKEIRSQVNEVPLEIQEQACHRFEDTSKTIQNEEIEKRIKSETGKYLDKEMKDNIPNGKQKLDGDSNVNYSQKKMEPAELITGKCGNTEIMTNITKYQSDHKVTPHKQELLLTKKDTDLNKSDIDRIPVATTIQTMPSKKPTKTTSSKGKIFPQKISEKNSTTDEKNGKLLIDQSGELLHSPSNKKGTQSTEPKEIENKPFDGMKKIEINSELKKKSAITGTDKSAQGKSGRIIREETAEFLNHLKMYDNESSTQPKIFWLRESKIIPRKKFDTNQKNLTSNVLQESTKEKNDSDNEKYLFNKEQTDAFLKDHKDYHDKQRIEDINFFNKYDKPENELWLSSKIPKRNKLMNKIKKMLSPTAPKRTNSSEIKHYPLFMNETAEFLNKNRYFIHEDEVCFKNSQIPYDVSCNDEIGSTKIKNQLAMPKGKVNQKSPNNLIKKTGGVLSKINSVIGGSSKQDHQENEQKLIKQQTADFLRDLKTYNSSECEVSAKSKIVWLSESAILPQEASEVHQKKLNSSKTVNEDTNNKNNTMYRYIQNDTDRFLKDHIEYHNRQRNEDNKFYQKVKKPINKFWLSSYIVNKIDKAQNIKNSPQVSKSSQQNVDVKKYSLLREQTAEFLGKNRYLIHKEEIALMITNDSTPKLGQKEKGLSKATANQLTKPNDKVNQTSSNDTGNRKTSTFSKLKSLISGSSKQQQDKKVPVLIKKQTQQFLDDLKKFNNEQYAVFSKSKIVWLNESNIIPRKDGKLYETSVPLQYKEENRNDIIPCQSETNQTVSVPEGKLCQSSTMEKKNVTVQQLENLKSSDLSNKTELPGDKERSLLLLSQTAEFLKKNQYSIHKEEIIPDKTNKTPAVIIQRESDISKVTEKKLSKQKDQFDKISPRNNGKAETSKLSKIKSLMHVSPKKSPDNYDHKLITQRTREFLENLRNYDNREYVSPSKSKIIWLSEVKINPSKVSDILEKKVSTTLGNQSRSTEHADNIKKHTDSFLKDHKGYHDRLRIEDNKFYQKIGKPYGGFWLSSNIPKKNSIAQKIKKLISPKMSKKAQDPGENYPLLRDQTAEFLEKHQYLIHEGEVNFKIVKNIPDGAVKDETNISKTSANQLSMPKDTVNHPSPNNVGNSRSPFARIKSLLGGKPKTPAPNQEDYELIKEQTTEFLKKLKIYSDSGFETSTKHQFSWLSDQIANPQTLIKKEQSEICKKDITGTDNVKNVRESEANVYLKQQTATFLKDHKEYHDQQRNELNAFLKKDCKSGTKNCIPLHTPNPKSIKNKIKKLFSQQNTKESLVIYNDQNNQYLKDETAQFLSKNRYLIHKEEVGFYTRNSLTELIEQNKDTDRKSNTNQSSKKSLIKNEKVKKNTITKTKSAIGGTTKQREASNHKIISAQNKEFLENLKNYNDFHHELSLKLRVPWLSEQRNNSQSRDAIKISPEVEKRSSTTSETSDTPPKSKAACLNECKPTSQKHNVKLQKRNPKKVHNQTTIDENNSEYNLYLLNKQKTDKFLEDEKIYHDNQKLEENKFYQKINKPWLSSSISKDKNLAHKITKLLSTSVSKKPHQSSKENSDVLIRDETAKFLKKNQYSIYEEEINPKSPHSSSDQAPEKKRSQLNAKETSVSNNKLSENKKDIGKAKKGTFSKIKSLMAGSQKPLQTEEEYKMITRQTAKFLEDMKTYSDKQYETISNQNCTWLSEKQVNPEINEPLLKKVYTKVSDGNNKNDDDSEMYRFMKKHTGNFLKDHKNYHDRQRIEDNRFFQKESEQGKLQPSSSTKKSSLAQKIRKVFSPTLSKKPSPATDEKSYLLFKDQTDEFLHQNRYLIYEEEINQKSNHNRPASSVEEEIHPTNVPATKLSVSNKVDPASLSTKPTEGNKTKDNGTDYKMLLKQQTDAFLKDHKDYHDKQRIEDNKFAKRLNELKGNFELSSNIPKKNYIARKIKKLLSPAILKEAHHSDDKNTYLLLKDQTAEFLNKNQYLIHEREVYSNNIPKTANTESKEVLTVLKETSSLSTAPIDEPDHKNEKMKINKPSKTTTAPQLPIDDKSKLISKQAGDFLEHLRKYNNSEYQSSSKFHNIWLSEINSENQTEAPQKKIRQKVVEGINSDRKNQEYNIRILEQANDDFMKNHKEYHDNLWNDYNKYPKKINISQEKLRIESNARLEDNRTLEGKNGESLLEPYTSKKGILSKMDCQKVGTEETIKATQDMVQGGTEELLKHSKENDYVNTDLLVSNEKKHPPILKKKVTFSDYQTLSEKETSNPYSTDKFSTIKLQSQMFLKKTQDYHHEQWSEYRKFQHQKNKIGEENNPNVVTQISPVLLKIENTNLLYSPQKTVDTINEKSMEFPKEQQLSNNEREIYQNKMKPKPSPRKSKTNQEKHIKPNNSQEEYLLMKRSVVLFLQDNQTYHNKERKELISFSNNQATQVENSPKPNSVKESRSKSNLLSKLKSLAGGHTEKGCQDKKRKGNELKKQTAEFLISQKCFWDLHKTAEIAFVEKNQNPNHSKQIPENNLVPPIEKINEVKLQNVSHEKTHEKTDNLTEQPPKDNHEKDYKFLKEQNELFLNNHQMYHDNQMKDFIAFSVSGKLNRNESHTEGESEQNDEPQHSSQNQKTLEIHNSANNKFKHTVQSEEKANDLKSTRNLCEIFLNTQRHYNDSANEGWRRYVMYKPEAAIIKKNVSKSSHGNSKKTSASKRTPELKSLHHSHLESQKIDYEVNLHKTKLFLENLKKHHDNLQNEFSKYVPKTVYKIETSEPQTNQKKHGVLAKIKSMLPSSHSKDSYNVQKAKLSQNQKDITKSENEPIITKFLGSHDYRDPKIEKEDLSKLMLKEQTSLFLKDHQDYHNRQYTDCVEYFGNSYKEQQILAEEESGKIKKSNKGMISKIKSLLGADSSKKLNKKDMDIDDDLKIPTKIFLEDQKRYSNIENSAEKKFNSSKTKFYSKKFETPNSMNDVISRTNKKEYSIENNDQAEQERGKSLNKTSAGQKREYNIPDLTTEVTETTITAKKTNEEYSNPFVPENEMSDRVIIPLLASDTQNISNDERKKYAREKLQTHEFLLNQKEFANVGCIHNKTSSKPPKSATIERKSLRNMHENVPKKKNVDISPKDVTNTKGERLAHRSENFNEEDNNIKSSLIQRVERPMSPTKTVFKEIRTRDNSPDNRVYILSEGYTITREGNEGEKLKNIRLNTNDLGKKQQPQKNEEHVSEEHMSSSLHYRKGSAISDVQDSPAEKILSPPNLKGQDSTSDSNNLPYQQIPQGHNLEAQQHTKRRTYREMEEEPRSFTTETKIEINGKVTRRYTTSCYLHQVPTAVWYSDTLILDLEEKSQKLHEKVYYDNQLRPDYWSETFETEVPLKENVYVSETVIPITQDADDIHYISLEHQQEKAQDDMVMHDE